MDLEGSKVIKVNCFVIIYETKISAAFKFSERKNTKIKIKIAHLLKCEHLGLALVPNLNLICPRTILRK